MPWKCMGRGGWHVGVQAIKAKGSDLILAQIFRPSFELLMPYEAKGFGFSEQEVSGAA